jgi:hypothetical protein
MPAWYMAIMMGTEEITWSPKSNPGLTDSGPDDHRLIVEFEGDLERVPWITNLSCDGATVDVNMLAASEPALFDKSWLRGRGLQKATIAAMGHHYMIDIQL